MTINHRFAPAGTVIILWMLPLGAVAQWDVFEDPEVDSVCSVLNAASLEFAVRSCDGALVLITGEDAGFSNTFVTLDGTVEIDGAFAGVVVFEEDADGFFTLWWLSEAGFVIDFDDLAFEPFETDFLPSDFAEVPCDAAEFWDDDGDCGAALGSATMQPVVFVDDGGFTPPICGLAGLTSWSLTLAGMVGMQLTRRGRRGVIRRRM